MKNCPENPTLGLPACGRHAALLLCLLLYGGLMWVWGVGRLDFHDSMESSRALVVRGMIQSGDYVIPRLGTHPYLAKPPLFYWAGVGTSLLMGGVSEVSVRAVSALSILAIVLLLYLAMRPLFGPGTALLACAAAVTMPIAFEAATAGQVDPLLALCVAVSVLGAYFMLEAERHSRLYAVLCGVGLAAGVLTKGPIVLMFFVPGVLVYLGFRHGGPLTGRPRWCAVYLAAAAGLVWLVPVLNRALGGVSTVLYLVPTAMLLYFAFGAPAARARRWEWAIVLGVTIALTAPWPILAAHRLTLHTLLEALGKETYGARVQRVGTANFGPIWLYFVEYPMATLPYSLFAPLAFLPGYAPAERTPRERLLLMAKCWLLVALVFFTAASSARRIRYMIPAFPAVALLAADVMARGARGELRERMNRYVRWVAGAGVYALCAAPVVLAVMWLVQIPDMRGWAAASAAVAAIGAGAGLYLHRVRRVPWAALLSLAVVLVGAKMLILIGQPEARNPQDSPRADCRALRAMVPPGQTLYMHELASRSAMYYLDVVPWRGAESAAAIRGRDQVFICMDAGEQASFQPPAGYRQTELGRMQTGKEEIILLRMDKL